MFSFTAVILQSAIVNHCHELESDSFVFSSPPSTERLIVSTASKMRIQTPEGTSIVKSSSDRTERFAKVILKSMPSRDDTKPDLV